MGPIYSYYIHTCDFGDRLEIDFQPNSTHVMYGTTTVTTNTTNIGGQSYYEYTSGSTASFSDIYRILKKLVLRRNGNRFEIDTYSVQYSTYEIESYMRRTNIVGNLELYIGQLPIDVETDVSLDCLVEFYNISAGSSYPARILTDFISRFEFLDTSNMLAYQESTHGAFAEALLAAVSPLYRYLLQRGMSYIGKSKQTTNQFAVYWDENSLAEGVTVEHQNTFAAPVYFTYNYDPFAFYRESKYIANCDLANYALHVFGVKTKKSVSMTLKILDAVQNIDEFLALTQNIRKAITCFTYISIDEIYNAAEFAISNPDKVSRKNRYSDECYGDFEYLRFMSREKTMRFALENPMLTKDTQNMVDFIRSHNPEYKIPNAKTLTELHDKVAVEDRRIRAKLSDKPIEYADRFLELEKMELSEGIGLTLPRRTADLSEWGRELDNCIASYAERAARGDTILIGVFVDHKINYAIEMHPETGYINQFYGKRNSEPPGPIKLLVTTTIYRWFASFGNVRSSAV